MDTSHRKRKFVITGASGRIGRSAAESLLAHGCEVRVIGRDAARLSDLISLGARLFVGPLEDRDLLEAAFVDVEGVLAMIPGWEEQKNIRQYMNDVGASIYSACLVCKIPRVVNLSDHGVIYISKGEYLSGLQDQEYRLNRLPDAHVLHLRPPCYLPNFLRAVDKVLYESPNQFNPPAFAAVVPEAIGQTAAEFLAMGGFAGKNIVEFSERERPILRRAL